MGLSELVVYSNRAIKFDLPIAERSPANSYPFRNLRESMGRNDLSQAASVSYIDTGEPAVLLGLVALHSSGLVILLFIEGDQLRRRSRDPAIHSLS